MFSMFLTYILSLVACAGSLWFMFFKKKDFPKPSIDDTAMAKWFTLFIMVPCSFIPFLNTVLAIYLAYMVVKGLLAEQRRS
jgi:hypothetical protein